MRVTQLISKLMGSHALKAALDRLSALRAGMGRDPAKDSRRAATVAVAGATLSIVAALVVAHWESKVAEVAFNSRANNIATTMQTGLNEYLSKIVALRALFEASEQSAHTVFILPDHAASTCNPTVSSQADREAAWVRDIGVPTKLGARVADVL
jgi:predicted amino acid dehydrogenase